MLMMRGRVYGKMGKKRTVVIPVNTVAPVVTGTPMVGQVLSCTTGTWLNSPTGYVYTWLRNDALVIGADSPNYTIVSADVGATIDCFVKATNAFGYDLAYSNAVGPVVPIPGGEAVLVGEANGFATDFTWATDAQRVAVKVAGVTTPAALDSFYQNAGTSPKLVFNASGVLVWSPHNYAINSEDLTGWTNTNSSDAGSLLTAAAGSAIHNIIKLSGTGALVSGQPWITSVSLLQGTHRYAYVTQFRAINNWLGVVVDMQTGAITQTALGVAAVAIPNFTPSIVSEPGGKFRVTVGEGSANTTAITIKVGFAAAATGQTFDANGDIVSAPGTLNFSIERAQVAKGQVPVPYLTTTSAARFGLPVDYDPITHVCKGVLNEPITTNSVQNACQLDGASWGGIALTRTANVAIAPNGFQDADKLAETATTTNWSFGIAGATAAATITFSVYAKAAERNLLCLRDDTGAKGDTFNLTTGALNGTNPTGVTTTGGPVMQNVGNGWYRCSIPCPNATGATARFWDGVGALSYAGVAGWGMYIWGVQWEPNPVATSLIQTFAGTMTRGTDLYNFTSASINYSATAGSWWAELYPRGAIAGQAGIVAANGSTMMALYINSTGPFGCSDGTGLLRSVTTMYGQQHRVASAFQVGDRALTADGLAVVADAGQTTNLLAPGTVLNLNNGSGACINGWLYKIRYVPRRKTNPELVTETT